ncbi:MAG TPA: hypothetical protein VGM66_12870, partial [Candidatus Udaeobacter sp.]
EERSRTDATGPKAQKDRERNEDKKPVEGRFKFQSLGISRLASANQPVRLRVARGRADSSVRR